MQFPNVVFLAAALVTGASAFAHSASLQGEPMCAGQHYNPSTYTCYGNRLLCPIMTNGITYKGCGTACYNPNQYVCSGEQLCPRTNRLRCGAACYSSNEYRCENDQLVVIIENSESGGRN
jgi:hypothetical protein